MKKFRTFNPVEFNSYVKFINDAVKNVISNTKAKDVICQAGKDNNYNVEDVYQYLHEIMVEAYPEYMLPLNKRDWRSVYNGYMDDDDLAPKLQKILELRGRKKDNDFYRDSFFEAIRELGNNPYIMKIDMALDTFGWIWVLETILKKADENPFTGEFAVKIKIKKETSKSKKISKAENPVKGRAKSIAQYTKYNVLIRIFSSVNEAIEWLNTTNNKKHHPKSIHQSCNTGGIAYGYLWKYLDEISETKVLEEIEFQDEVKTSIVAETIIPAKSLEERKFERSEKKVSELLVAYYMNNEKQLDKTREIGRYTSQQDACNSLGINKGVLSNYLKGRKESIFWKNEDGLKVRIGVEKLAA